MIHRSLTKWIGLGLGLLVAFAACGESGVVGGECRKGLTFCDGRCVDPNANTEHCGACGKSCDAGEACNDGECGPPGAGGSGGSGGSNFGGNAGAAGDNGSTGQTGGSSGNGSGASSSGGAGGNGGRGGASTNGNGGSSGGLPIDLCVPPFETGEACGDCDTECPAAAPYCAPIENTEDYECVDGCEDPLVACDDQCVDILTHPLHCGRCFHVCPSGVCVNGICQGDTAGHIVYACMNYQQIYAESTQTRLLGNAVFLRNREPARVLSYTAGAPGGVIVSTDAAIRWAGSRMGRTAEIVREGDLDVIESSLNRTDFDVFLVYDQKSADSGDLALAGAQLASVLSDFTIEGGIVVMLSSGTGVGEMPDFATSSGMAQIGAETDYTYELAHNQANGDALGLGVVTPFMTLMDSCLFETTETPSVDTVFVITDTEPEMGLGLPVVLHKIIAP